MINKYTEKERQGAVVGSWKKKWIEFDLLLLVLRLQMMSFLFVSNPILHLSLSSTLKQFTTVNIFVNQNILKMESMLSKTSSHFFSGIPTQRRNEQKRAI